MKIILELPKNEKIHRAMGSILQGALMEIIGVETSKECTSKIYAFTVNLSTSIKISLFGTSML